MTLTENKALLAPEYYFDFITGGHARFTVESDTTGKHYHFKVSEHKETKGMFFVKVLTDYASDSWLYIGYINRGEFKLSKKGNINADAPSFKAFDFLFSLAKAKRNNVNLKMYHLGHCCRCGRPLTDPESIKSGIGPVCNGLRNL